METDPAAPINFMEEPIHYHHQNHDCQKTGPSLEVESRNVLGEILDNAHGDEPGHQSGGNPDTDTNGNRFPLVGVGTDHAGHDCREYQNTFQAFAENQHSNIERSNRSAGMRQCGIRSSVGRDPLPYENAGNEASADEEQGLKSWPDSVSAWRYRLDSGRAHYY